MKQYLDGLETILTKGKLKTDRTGTGTISYFGLQMRFDLQTGFPAVTTKKLAWKSVVSELLWFLEGSNDERRLREILYGDCESSKETIWTANAESSYWKPRAKFSGDLGRIYGVQWRHWKTPHRRWLNSSTFENIEIDQIKDLVNNIKLDPSSRRHILTAWNPAELDQMALPPCHILSQFDVTDGIISCQLYQRSADFPLGVPFNIASYALLTHMIAKVCNLKVGDFIHSIGDAHIYQNQIDGVKEQLSRNPLPLPILFITEEHREIDTFRMDDFYLEGYDHYPPISFPFST